jgi:uncharacterized protein (DUF934 family)
MPKLIKLTDAGPAWADDIFIDVADEDAIPDGPVILSLARFQAEGDALIGANRPVGVRVQTDEAVEDLAYDLPRITVVALVFPKFRDGRHYSSARILRERFKYEREIRAVGDVLLEQARFMIRCGIDAFAPADGSTPEAWTSAHARYRHVYQRATDDLVPAFEERRG